MTSPAPDHGLLVQNFRLCVENSRSCPSLFRLSLDALATTLWKTADGEIANCLADARSNFCCPREILVEKQDEMLNQVKPLIPRLLIPHVEYALALKITEIFKANNIEEVKRCNKVRGLLWTPNGKINKRETIRLMIKNKMGKKNALCLACHYCLEKDVMRLWGECSKPVKFYYPPSKFSNALIRYWDSFVAGNNVSPTTVEDITQNCHRKVMETVVIEYFWPKLNDDERDIVLGKLIVGGLEMYTESPDFGYFLLTRATDFQLTRLMESYWFDIFVCLSVSTKPEVKLYMTTMIEHMYGFINEDQRSMLFCMLLGSVTNETAIIYEKLIMRVWNEGSDRWRRNVLEGGVIGFEMLLNSKGIGMLMRMFQDATEEDKWNFLSNYIDDIVIKVLKKPSMVEKFLSAFLRSEDDVNDFKLQVAEFGMEHSIQVLVESGKFEAFIDFCHLSDEEMMRLKSEFCCFENLKGSRMPFTLKTVPEIDKFLKWCSLPEAESCELRKLWEKQATSSYLVDLLYKY